MWRCPHCGTPQTETARCWVCRRSSTSCATCRNFRHAVAVNIGYCGLDRTRSPLQGDEIRACWEPSAAAIDRSGPADPGDAVAPAAPNGGSPTSPIVADPAPVPIAPATPRFDLSFFTEPEI